LNIQLERIEGRHPASKPDAPAAIRGIDLEVRAGEQVAVIGPSGAGKTTLLQLMSASLKPVGGRVLLDGEDPWALSVSALQRLRGRIFQAPQTPPLPPRQRVITALTAARLPQMSLLESVVNLVYPRCAAQARDALEGFDVAEKLWERVDRLSGGERQRVGLARALMSPAEVWLVDEPLSALDPKRARLAIDQLISSARARGVSLITTLHQVDVATERFPRVIGLRDGVCVFDLPAQEVTRARLADLYAQFEHELTGTPQAAVDIPGEPEPARIIHCR
jgi:phosphonate transport system ATP-binding protein